MSTRSTEYEYTETSLPVNNFAPVHQNSELRRMCHNNPKNVWIVNHYAPHPLRGNKVGLHLQLARQMHKYGWHVQVITASTSHPDGSQAMPAARSSAIAYWENTQSLFVRAREYEGNGMSRLLNMLEFGIRIFFPTTVTELPAPKVVVGRITNPLAALAALRWSRRFEVPFVLEISDIWPDTFIQLEAMSKNDPRTRVLGKIEQRLLKASTAVMSPLPGVGDYLRDKGLPELPFYWVPNGIAAPAREVGCDRSEKSWLPFRFVYVGSLGNANAVDTIIRAFNRYITESHDSETELEIIGSGPLRGELQELAQSLPSAKQIHFAGRIPYSEVHQRLSAASALVANMRDLPLYKYGIALNKIFDYLLSGTPIIFATNAINNLVRDAGAGITIPADDEAAMAAAMNSMVHQDPENLSKWGGAGRKFVVENYLYKHSAEKFHWMLNELVGGD